MTRSTTQADTVFRILIAQAAVGIVVIDAHGTIVIFNGACERLFGYSADEVLSRDVNLLMPEPYFEAEGEYLARHSDPAERLIIAVGRDVEGRRKDGSTFPMYLSVGEGRLDNQKIYVGIIHDCTSYRDAAALLQEREARLHSILETIPDAMITIDENGSIESFSAAATRLFGYEAAEAIGQNVKMLMPAPYREGHDGHLAHYKRTGDKHMLGAGRVMMMGLKKDGTIFRMELSVGEVWVGKKRLFTGFIHDITERQAAKLRFQDLQSDLWHASRLNAMGQLALHLGHELNQPLTAIGNYVRAAIRVLTRVEHPDAANIRELMTKASAQATRAGEIVHRSRAFVEKRQTMRSKQSLNRVVEEAIELSIVNSTDTAVTVKTAFDPSLPDISADRVQIQQVLVNLIRNAVEAMHEMPTRILTITTAPDGAKCLQVAVSDTGPGLSKEAMSKLFQPFVTTKPSGMGVGLSICSGIMEAHGGRIWADANAAGGATFHISLPIERRAG